MRQLLSSAKKIGFLLFGLVSPLFVASQVDYAVGNGTTNGGQYNQPTPFEDYYDQSKTQFLYTAADLNAAGIVGPIAIMGIKWNVENRYTQGAIPDYRIHIGSTTQSDLSSWVASVPNVVRSNAGPYTTTLGINSFVFPTPFIWNGTDNIVIQTCTGEPTPQRTCYTYTSESAVNYHATSYISTRYYRIDCQTTDMCQSTSYSGTYTSRPNIIFSVGKSCVDTPFTTVAGPDKVCPNRAFTVKPADYYANATYSWEYSTNGVTWSNFTGIPTVVGAITDSITQPKWYRVTIKCNTGNYKYTTAPHKVNIAPFYYCYCENSATTDGGGNIGNLTIINQKKDDTTYKKELLVTGTGLPVYNNATMANRRYTSYHDSLAWPCFYRDTTYKFVISQIHSGGSFVPGVAQVYIDYDRDGLYNPNTERVFVKALDGTGTPPYILEVSATVPSTADFGPTGMRVIVSADTVKGAPCDSIPGAGEVEDYVVEICHRPCDAPVNAGIVVSTDTSMCASYEYKLTDTTYEKQRSAFTRAWQVSGDNINWFDIANSQGKDTLQRIFTGQPLFYRLRTVCLPSTDTNYSPSTRINVKPGYKCYCYSKAIGGLGVDTSDIGGVTIADYARNDGGPHLLNIAADRPRTDFTDIVPVELYTDSMYKFSVYHTMPVVEHGDAKITIFMDFNNDHDYDIPEERVYTGYTTIGNHTLLDNVIIPVKAITDVPTGMRVILNNNVGPNIPSDSACGPYQSGETEDYLVIFRKKWAEGVGNTPKLSGFSVNPNPTTGKFYVQFSTNSEIKSVKVRITNVTGQVIEEGSYEHRGGMFYHEMDMSNRSKGVYFVELQADGDKLMRKLVVQ